MNKREYEIGVWEVKIQKPIQKRVVNYDTVNSIFLTTSKIYVDYVWTACLGMVCTLFFSHSIHEFSYFRREVIAKNLNFLLF